jgi:hypothetical protein
LADGDIGEALNRLSCAGVISWDDYLHVMKKEQVNASYFDKNAKYGALT